MNPVAYRVYRDRDGLHHWSHTTEHGVYESPGYTHRREAYAAIYRDCPGHEPDIFDVE